MSLENQVKLTREKKALLLIEQLEAKLDALEREPIAIISMACRFPGGVTSPAELWELLASGRDAITEVPKSRWDVDAYFDPDPDAIGKTYTRWGGFVGEVDRFDAAFFGISPREAKSIDPQERLLLETTWEVLERAGIQPERMAGSVTGVYMGICGTEYQAVAMSEAEFIDAYSFLGTAHSAIVGRLSYWLGLQGPNFPVDTACSSSLVALHLACQGLRQGECDLAIAGGVNLLLSPDLYVYFSRLKAMSSTGRCHTFSADADGYVRAEGCGVVLLKRLSDAKRDGDTILAVIRGSAVNQDGRSSGLTAPNGPAQQEVIRRALRKADIPPETIDCVECHGTGTSLGDPIEVQALSAVYGEGRGAEHPVVVGSIKSNIGHTEGAAGIAGVMKAVLALQHRRIPKTLHVTHPNPHIPWEMLPVRIATETMEWISHGSPRRAGVSSFGFSGTNAHVILEEAPERALIEASTVVTEPQFSLPIVISGRTEAALVEQVTRLGAYLGEHSEVSLQDLAFSLATKRTHFAQRLVIPAKDRRELEQTLQIFTSTGDVPPGAVRTSEGLNTNRIAFLFTGQGSQHPGMGKGLYEAHSVFRAALDDLATRFAEYLDRPLLDVMFAEKDSNKAKLLHQVNYAQPVLFALEVALYKLWESWGVKPDVVMGHSLGELCAAHVAGVFDVEDACRLVAARGRLMQALPEGGAMASLQASEEETRAAIVKLDLVKAVDLAALNVSDQTVISGDAVGVETLVKYFEAEGRKALRLAVLHAVHSHYMEAMLEEFRKVAETVSYHAPRLALVSNVTGKRVEADEVTQADYWVRQVRQTVRFADGMQTLYTEGATIFVEVGPRPVLCRMGALSLPKEAGATWLPSLCQGKEDWSTVLQALVTLHVCGVEVAWTGFFEPLGGRRVDLPTYAFQRERYWLEVQSYRRSDTLTGAYLLSGKQQHVIGDDRNHILSVGTQHQPFLLHHVVHGRITVPGAFHVAVILSIARGELEWATVTLRDVFFPAALFLEEDKEVELHIRLRPDGEDVFDFEMASLHVDAEGEEAWQTHATGRLEHETVVRQHAPVAIPLRDGQRQVEIDQILDGLSSVAIDWGPHWRWLQSVVSIPSGSHAHFKAPEGITERVAPIHPSLLDNFFGTAVYLDFLERSTSEEPFLPFALSTLRLYEDVAAPAIARGTILETIKGEGLTCNLTLATSSGHTLLEIDEFTFKKAPRAAFLREREGLYDYHHYRVDWSVAEMLASTVLSGRWCLIVPQGGGTIAETIQAHLKEAGVEITVIGGFDAALKTIAENIIVLWETPKEEGIPEASHRITAEALAQVQGILSQEKRPRLIWMTRGAVDARVEDQVLGLAASPLWGLARTARIEHPDLDLILIDIGEDEADLDILAPALLLEGEPECAMRGRQVLVPRLARAREEGRLAVPSMGEWRLEIEEQGRLDRFVFKTVKAETLAAGQVRVAVRAEGLNFRLVLIALGMVPNLRFEKENGPCTDALRDTLSTLYKGSLCEFSGVVTEVGAGVGHLKAGDRVFGLGQGTFVSSVIADSRLVNLVPPRLSFEEAASIPVAFFTAWYGFFDLGRLQHGERVLIHAAAGGVGMAAVQLAQLHGAEVFGTANEAKWDVLRKMGLSDDHIASSRTLEFTESFRATTQGQGVDVVLNALAREFVDASLSLLRESGRFLEMGKTDIRDADWLAEHHGSVSYTPFDIIDVDPDRIQAILAEVSGLLAAGKLKPLPVRMFSMDRAPDALRYMAQARHIGKVVLVPREERALVRAEGTVLVTGGLGALGQHVARWLVTERGVKHVVLISRRGGDTPGARELVAELAEAGAEASVMACDVADAVALGALLDGISEKHPLKGVIHAAGILDDGVMSALTPERIATVFVPKVEGAWNLHQLTRERELDLFVLFSSTAGVLGSAGQGNYAAANTFLDALAHYRAVQGLPAVSIAWGPWAEGGMAAGLSESDQERMRRQGMEALTSEQGMALLAAASTTGEAVSVAMAFDARKLQRFLERSGAEVPALYRKLVRRKGVGAAKASALAQRLSALPEGEREAVLMEAVREEVAQVLGLSSAREVNPEQSLLEMGVDSLMAVELRNRLSGMAGIRLPATLAFDYPTVRGMTQFLLEHVDLLTEEKRPAVEARVSPNTFREPIAVVSMACRFPGGVTSPEELWELLASGRDAITEVPKSRWDVDAYFDPDPDAIGKTYTRWGGFVGEVDRFDAAFFGISPREAKSIDPQERLLLETTWEVLERAGIRPARLLSSATGVYMGICGTEYQAAAMSEAEFIDAYSYLGTAHSAMVGRISYWLGLEGPNFPVDTACSSSLVALHLACQGLRQGECDLAIAGGVNLLLNPELYVYFSRLKAMSPTGRCHTFSADADGYVRAEGCGIVLLKRLSDAKRDGDPILAVIRGSAVNQDGRSSGLTAPNGPAQQKVIRRALRVADLGPETIDYVECHGTGTSLGDPIEVHALSAVYGEGREAEHPVVVGSIKSNIGHTEGTAGIAGVIKAVLALQHRQIPKTLHVNQPNPHIPWEELPVRIATEAIEWPSCGTLRRVGVSSFGFSGTNAHVILEEAPEMARVETAIATDAHPTTTTMLPSFATTRSWPMPLVVSGRAEAALREQVRRLLTHLEAHPELSLLDVAYSLAVTRTHFGQRLVILAQERSELEQALETFFSMGVLPRGAAQTSEGAKGGRVVFLFTGHGSQYRGMGEGLYEAHPIFREALDDVAACFAAHLDRPLLEVMFAEEGSEGGELLNQPQYSHPAVFALEVALGKLWESWGVKPDVVMGHGLGEVCAAHVAGVFELEDACKMVAARGRLIEGASQDGAMALVQGREEEVHRALEMLSLTQAINIAALNAHEETVVSGDADAIEVFAKHFESQGRNLARLNGLHAYPLHPQAAMLEEIRQIAEKVRYQAPRIGFVSTITGQRAKAEEVTRAEYWVKQAYQTVRFADGMQTLHADGAKLFIELGSRAVLCAMGARCLPEEVHASWLPSLQKGRDDGSSMIEALAHLHVNGTEVSWSGFFAPLGGHRVDLPTYAFQRERYWLDVATKREVGAGLKDSGHPLLGIGSAVAGKDMMVFTTVLTKEAPVWVKDHVIFDEVILPGTGFLEMMRAAGEALDPEVSWNLSEVVIQSPLVFPEGGKVRVQVTVEDSGEAGQRLVRVYSQPDVDDERSSEAREWTLHAEGRLIESSETRPSTATLLPPAGAEPIEIGDLYVELEARGLTYGPSFQGLRKAWRAKDKVWGQVSLFEGVTDIQEGYGLHPALLDAAFHVMMLAIGEREAIYLPFEVERLSVWGKGASTCWVEVEKIEEKGEVITSWLSLYDEERRGIGRVEGLRLKQADALSLKRAGEASIDRYRFEVEWTEVELPAREMSGKWALWCYREGDSLVATMQARLTSFGVEVEVVSEFSKALTMELEGVMCLWNGEGDAARVAHEIAAAGLVQLQELAACSTKPEVVWVTCEAVCAREEDSVSGLAASTLWGLARTARSEHPDLDLQLMDIREREGDADLSALPKALRFEGEPECALRGEQILVPRLVRAKDRGRLAIPTGGAWRLEIGEKGRLDRLVCKRVLEKPLDAGQIRVAIKAAGLNFRDVLNALGMVPIPHLGLELAGEVTEVGEGVSHLQIGDGVFGLGRGTFSSTAITDARMVTVIPAGLSFEEAASLPLVFLTAWYGLFDLGGLKRGEKVLIHAAAGGVGMAAVQLAQRMGAEVFGTASEGKWEVLRGMGLGEDHIASSRTLEFAERIRTVTKDRGVDIVLNALSKEFVDESLSLLGEGGRFLEMGKTDIRERSWVEEHHRGVSYQAFDLMEAGPERIQSMLQEITTLLSSRKLRPLPVRTFTMERASEAFRYMAQAKHIGKVVLVPREERPLIREDGAVLVTGGMGALGQEIARWLVKDQGVKHVVLTSRRGEESPGAKEFVAELAEAGGEASVVACDVTDATALSALLEELAEERPLRGVIHAAGVLDDGVLESLTPERLARVFAPKVDGAWHLHRLTRDKDLDMFVLFSSTAGVMGSAGQGNYAAANTFMDAMAQYRASQGLPAVSIAWGPWVEGGMAARLSEGDQKRMRRQGMEPLSSSQGLALFEEALSKGEPLSVAAALDSRKLQKYIEGSGSEIPALYRKLIKRREKDRKGTSALAQRLMTLPEREREAALLEVVRREVAQVLGLSSSREIKVEQPLQEMGVDSLMAVELRNRLSGLVGHRLPATIAFDYPTVLEIAHYLLKSMNFLKEQGGSNDSATDIKKDATVKELAKKVEELSDEEVTEKVAELLSRWSGKKEGNGSR